MAIMKRVLSTVANFELATYYLHDWAMMTLATTGRYGLDSTVLEGWMANEYRYETNIESVDPRFVWLNGHGDIDRLAGQNNEIILNLGNVNTLNGRVCYAFSCLTAQQLGLGAVNAGCDCYIGYDETFVFYLDVNAFSRITDKYAKWFMVPGMQIPLSLFQGKTTLHAYGDSQYVFDYGIDHWTESEDPMAPQMLAALNQDKRSQRLLGSISEIITPDQRFSPPSLPDQVPWQFGMDSLIALTLIGTIVYYFIREMI